VGSTPEIIGGLLTKENPHEEESRERPEVATFKWLNSEILKLEKELGLTPVARKKANIEAKESFDKDPFNYD